MIDCDAYHTPVVVTVLRALPGDADRVEGCVVCHLPHGSINRRLLTHREVRMQCLQCHSNILPFHDQSPGSQYRNCIDCHTEIHGSHLDPWYFR